MLVFGMDKLLSGLNDIVLFGEGCTEDGGASYTAFARAVFSVCNLFHPRLCLGRNSPSRPPREPFAPLDLFSEPKTKPYTRCLKKIKKKPTTVRVRVNIEVRRTLRYVLIYRNIKSATKKMKKLFSNTRGKNFFDFFAFSMTQPLGRWWALNEATGIR